MDDRGVQAALGELFEESLADHRRAVDHDGWVLFLEGGECLRDDRLGFVVAGGTVDCGSGATCPEGSGRQCALVEKFDSAGRLTWARAYLPGSGLSAIAQTADGGYIAAGTYNSGALILKLDRHGAVQWQRDLGPGGSIGQAYFSAVAPAAGGGYVAAGDWTYELTPWLAKTGATGSLLWEHLYYQPSPQYGASLSEDFDASAVTPGGGFLATGPTENPYNSNTKLYLVKADSYGLAGTCPTSTP